MKTLGVLFLFLICSPSIVFADIKQITADPTPWKIENYFGDKLVVFFSGSVCAGGRLSFPNAATVGDKNRFWGTVLTSRALKSKMYVRYNTNDNCEIVSFGVAK